MQQGDVQALADVEREAFPNDIPGTSFARELSNRLASYLVACISPDDLERVDGDGRQEEIVGYAGLWFIIDEAHLISLAVLEAHRRRGIGRQLLIAALELAMEKQAILMTLEVRASNTAAQALYQQFGFSRVGIRRGYYTDNHEDAYLMTVNNIATPDFRAKLDELKASEFNAVQDWIKSKAR